MGQRIKQFREDDVILLEGMQHDVMYKILSGSVTLYFHYQEDDEYLIGILSKGHSFGEYGLLTKQPEIYTIVANEDTAVMEISEAEFDDFLLNNHGNVLDIVNNMARTLSIMRMNFSMMMDELSELVNKNQLTKENFNKLMRSAKKVSATEGGQKYVVDFEVLKGTEPTERKNKFRDN